MNGYPDDQSSAWQADLYPDAQPMQTIGPWTCAVCGKPGEGAGRHCPPAPEGFDTLVERAAREILRGEWWWEGRVVARRRARDVLVAAGVPALMAEVERVRGLAQSYASSIPWRTRTLAAEAERDALRAWKANAEITLTEDKCVMDADAQTISSLLTARAKAWDAGAETAWGESGEGWNGEYPPGAEPNWRKANPYRAALGES